MKYTIERASLYSDYKMEHLPCDGCVKEKVHEIMWDESVAKDTVERWTKEVDDLIKFVDTYGKIVVGRSDIAETPYEITIYDDYIE